MYEYLAYGKVRNLVSKVVSYPDLPRVEEKLKLTELNPKLKSYFPFPRLPRNNFRFCALFSFRSLHFHLANAGNVKLGK